MHNPANGWNARPDATWPRAPRSNPWTPDLPAADTARVGRAARGRGLASLASLRDVAPAEWEEAGIGSDSRVFGLRVEERIVAVAGYERRGLAAEPLKAVLNEALAENLLPQYRARDGNTASVTLARRVGFVEYGWMATVRVHSAPLSRPCTS